MHRHCWLAAALAVLAAWGSLATAQGVRPSRPVATVNGKAISLAELEAVLKASGPVPVHLPEAQRRQRQVEALGLLIDTQLMRQFLDKNAPSVSPDEVARRFAQMKDGLDKQNKSLAEFCHDTNQTEEQLRAGIADHLRWSAYVAGRLGDEAVEKYFRDNRDFFDKVTVEASHIVMRVPPTASDKEKAEIKAKLQGIRKQIVEQKADFAELARKYSQDPRAAQGGELGAFPRRWVFDEPFAAAAFALKEGEVSDVVATEFGYHLIKVTKRNPGTPSDFAKIKEVVREFCAEDERQQILARERKASKIEIDLP